MAHLRRGSSPELRLWSPTGGRTFGAAACTHPADGHDARLGNPRPDSHVRINPVATTLFYPG